MLFLIWVQLLFSAVHARRIIKATSLVPCMENSGVQASKFEVTFTPEDRTLSFDVSLDVEVSGQVYADILLYVYGFRAIHETVDPCTSQQLQQLCPLTTGEIDIISKTQLSQSVVDSIPGVAYTVPDIDAFAIVKVYMNDTDELKACIRAEVTNTKTVEQTSVKWVTACLSGAGLLVSALLTYIGSSYTSQKIAATTTLLFTYFQSMSVLNMIAVDRVPPIANAWTENVVWSVGLVRVTFMQEIFRWFVQSTGGHPTTYMLYNTISVLVQRRSLSVPPRVADFLDWRHHARYLGSGALSAAKTLSRRANELAKETYARPNHFLVVYRGIKRVGYEMGIEETSIVATSYTIYGFIVFCMCFIFLCLWGFFRVLARKSRNLEKHRHASQYAPMLPQILKGIMLKLIMFSFPAVMMFSMWEWIQQDSAGVIVISVFFFVATLAVLLWNLFRVWQIARRSVSETGTPAFLLYSHAPTMHRYGFLYHEFNSKFYYFGALNLAYQFVVCLFVAFAQSSGKTQGLALFLIELLVLVIVCVYRPWMDSSLNIIQIVMQVIKTFNALFYLFFSNLFTQPLLVNSIMAVIYFILNAAFSCALLIYIIVVCVLTLFRRDRETEAVMAKDDRMSFISDNVVRQGAAGELAALGQAVQADHEVGENPDWFQEATSQNPFEAAPMDSVRNSQRTSTMNTSTSVPTFAGDIQEGVVRQTDSASEASFGLGSADEKSEKKSKKWWVL